VGTVTFAPGSMLAKLFGKTKVSGHNIPELIASP
jgi:hypothetical protein